MVTNTGTAILNISNISVVGSDFSVSGGGIDCVVFFPPRLPQLIGPGESVPLTIAFFPTASGTRTGTLVIQDDGSDSPQQAPLTGVGVDSGEFAVGTASGSDSAMVNAGQTATYQLNVAAGSGVAGIIQLDCSNLPMGTACGFSPLPVAVEGADVMKVTLSVSTTPHSGAFLNRPLRYAGLWSSLTALLGIVLIRRPHRIREVLIALIALGTMGFLLSCGGGSSSKGPSEPTPSGTFPFTLTATSGNTSHSSQLTLIVQ